MTALTTKTDNSKSKTIALLENILFVLCITVIVLRTTFTEAPAPQSAQIQAVINDAVYSLSVSAVLIFALLLWVLARLFSRRFSYRTTTMEIGLGIFLIAAILASLYAANKRAAISSSLMLLAPIFMAILLAQLLDSNAKIKILLITITALGIVAAWQSAEQFFVSNNIMLEQYKNDPNSILQPLGIQPGSLNHMLLEHRIYSKDVRASFTTSNSAGSFAVLASFASIALLAERLKHRKVSPAPLGNFVLAAFALAAVLFGLVLTRSKGAIAAFLIAAAVFDLLLHSKCPNISKNIILAACIIGSVALVPLVAYYGLKFGRLPGGNSMLVRWQYWQASARMTSDHALTGIGPGNFATLYHQYKPPSAPETVSDPHCFVLSILTQYGPLGLLGFLTIILVPLWRTSLAGTNTLESPPRPRFKILAPLCIIAPVAAMLLLRPFIIPPSTAVAFYEKLYILFSAYVTPAAAFMLGCGLLIKSLQSIRNREPILRGSSKLTAAAEDGYALQNTAVTTAALFAGLLGVLIHNLIDFAIFEPGVLTTFCAILAVLIALGKEKSEQPPRPLLASAKRSEDGSSAFCFLSSLPLNAVVRGVFFLIFSVSCLFCYFNYALLPVAKSTAKITKARRPIELGQFKLAHNLLAAATLDDALSPDAPLMNGRLFLQRIRSEIAPQEQMFDDSEQALFTAARRNPADSRIFESLADVYPLRARLQPDQSNQWLGKALDSASIAISLYPGDADLHIQLAQIADELGLADTALKHYQTAVQIEDSFREQFRLMYPGRNVFSRLGNEKYLLAKQRIRDLLEKSPQ